MCYLPIWLSSWINQHNIFRFQVGMDKAELFQFQQCGQYLKSSWISNCNYFTLAEIGSIEIATRKMCTRSNNDVPAVKLVG